MFMPACHAHAWAVGCAGNTWCITSRVPLRVSASAAPGWITCSERPAKKPRPRSKELCMPLFGRPDGELVKTETPVRNILPYVMRGRNESAIYHEDTYDITKARAWLRD